MVKLKKKYFFCVLFSEKLTLFYSFFLLQSIFTLLQTDIFQTLSNHLLVPVIEIAIDELLPRLYATEHHEQLW